MKLCWKAVQKACTVYHVAHVSVENSFAEWQLIVFVIVSSIQHGIKIYLRDELNIYS